jgi:hypothetical protein
MIWQPHILNLLKSGIFLPIKILHSDIRTAQTTKPRGSVKNVDITGVLLFIPERKARVVQRAQKEIEATEERNLYKLTLLPIMN